MGILLSPVKTQYLQILNIADTSIKHLISCQSTTMVNGFMYIMVDMVDTAFSYGRALIVCEFLQETLKVKESIVYMKSEMQILRFYLVGQN